MANIFIHFEPIGPVGEEIVLSPDLPQYVIRGKLYFYPRFRNSLGSVLANLINGE
jgi:hypothetical protein